jgi:hypothetical protein
LALCVEQSVCPPGAAVGTGVGFGVAGTGRAVAAGVGRGVATGVGRDAGRATTPIPGAWDAAGAWVGALTGVGSGVGAVAGVVDGWLEGARAGEPEAAGPSLAPAVGSVDGAGLPGPGALDGGAAVETTAIWLG